MLVKSRYNLCCEGPGREHLLYNTASGRFAALDEQAYAAYEQADASAFPTLAEQGFLVDGEADELAAIHAAFEHDRHDPHRLQLAIAPTYACNCSCPYCYEQDKATARSRMSPEVIDAIFAYLDRRAASEPFSELYIEWYGGDPSLCLDILEDVSARLISWCADHGVAYDAMMFTNGNLIKEEEAALVKRAQVSNVIITIDGVEAVHNMRRPAAGQDNPYQNIRRAIKLLQAQGILVTCMMNADKVNLPMIPTLNEELADLGVYVSPVKLNDYAHSFGTGRFSFPDFDLYTHEAYAQASFDIQKECGFKPGQIQQLLAPCAHFCSGQVEASLVIDPFGDVYKCDGWMGDKSRSLFNIVDDEPQLDEITFDPFKDDDCIACELLPLCMGNCSWERERCGWPCHPLKHTYADYLKEWRTQCDAPADGVTVLA